MTNDTQGPSEKDSAPIDWEDLRIQAGKLGITLSELQQQKKQQKLRVERKAK